MLVSTYADILRPREKRSAALYDIVLVLGGSLLIAISAQMAFRLPFSPVPVSAQTFAVLLLGSLLGARRGALCVLAYLAEGLAGLPVFAMAGAGLPVLLGPTGGFLIGFLAAAFVTGCLAQRGWDRRFATTILAMLAGEAAMYAPALVWLSFLVGFKASVVTGLLPFIPGDICKILLAAVILPSAWKLLKNLDLF